MDAKTAIKIYEHLVAAQPGNVVRAQQLAAEVLLATIPEQQQKVFIRLARGEQVKNIGTDLGIAAKTVAEHKRHVLDRLGLKNDTQLTALAIKFNIITVDDCLCIAQS